MWICLAFGIGPYPGISVKAACHLFLIWFVVTWCIYTITRCHFFLFYAAWFIGIWAGQHRNFSNFMLLYFVCFIFLINAECLWDMSVRCFKRSFIEMLGRLKVKEVSLFWHWCYPPFTKICLGHCYYYTRLCILYSFKKPSLFFVFFYWPQTPDILCCLWFAACLGGQPTDLGIGKSHR